MTGTGGHGLHRKPPGGANDHLPVAVIGAGPVGLATAAHLHAQRLPFVVFESGDHVGAAVREWGHVRLFSPWKQLLDEAGLGLLAQTAWTAPDRDAHPLGRELVTEYLDPLAAHPAIRPHLRVGATVSTVSRRGADKLRGRDREALPFELVVQVAGGVEERVLARAVIDASGTWAQPNPMGTGVPVVGERQAATAAVLAYRIPDVLGVDRQRYSGRTTLVVGAGHSAFNAVVDLATLAEHDAATRVVWAVRRATSDGLFGDGDADALAARGLLGRRVHDAVMSGLVHLVTGFRATAVDLVAGSARVRGETFDGNETVLGTFDRIVALTGFRPDLRMHSELRLKLDPVVEATPNLAPLIDPSLHSCGTVRPHGFAELSHPETGFFVVGMKSYGRAPTFLLLTGYEQVRSVVAAIAGDLHAAAVDNATARGLADETLSAAAVAASSSSSCG